jgi:hypothetical protein
MSTATMEGPTRTDALPPARRATSPAPPSPAPRSPAPRRTLFAVGFRSAMSAADARRLERAAGLNCDLHSKLHGDTVAPGLRRLDFSSGLFLARGAGEDEWRLEGRTWAHPAPGAVHRWRLWALAAARALDPGARPITSTRPERTSA